MHGISSGGVRTLPQPVQWLLPFTTLSPRGILSIITFKKLNIQAPKKNRIAHKIASIHINTVFLLTFVIYTHFMRQFHYSIPTVKCKDIISSEWASFQSYQKITSNIVPPEGPSFTVICAIMYPAQFHGRMPGQALLPQAPGFLTCQHGRTAQTLSPSVPLGFHFPYPPRKDTYAFPSDAQSP